MAQTDCVIVVGDENKLSDVENDCPPSKKFKQGRLPFKPLDHTSQSPKQGQTPPSSKKRKLSGNESPSAKHLKVVDLTQAKPGLSDCDPEVSSSSEAESNANNANVKSAKKVNTLDRFFKPKRVTRETEPEISSTNECIDLTENMETDVDSNEVEKPASEKKEEKQQDELGVDANKSSKKLDVSEKTTKAEAEAAEEMSIESADDENTKQEKKQEVDEDNEEENADDGTEILPTCDPNSSFVSDTSVCEAALKTPAKDAKAESMLKTPATKARKASVKTPVTSDGKKTPPSAKRSRNSTTKNSTAGVKTPSAAVTSDDNKTTPPSAKRSNLSEKKKKEKEDDRLRKKAEREKEIEEKKQQKEKERLEKKRQKDAEKAEKDKQKLEEKEKKDKERQEKLQQKEEEKKMKEKELAVKAEEKKKKEDEKRQKDEEKRAKEEDKRREEEEKARKAEKNKSMFKGFFIQKDPVDSPPKTKESKNSFFMPFEVKPNMRLAPSERRSRLTEEEKSGLDVQLEAQEDSDLYTSQLKSGKVKTGNFPSTWPRNADENDIEILSHDKETIEKVTHRAKFLKFHENTRPPYYGTWSKTSAKLSARNPFKQDEDLFDYEVDSDDEWEEEEPGESVSSDEEEEEGEKVDKEEEEEDGWMVPHGYLSDDEGIADDEGDVVSKQDIQKMRQAAWESELKRQAKPLQMLSIGCIWQGTTTEIAAQQLETLLKYKAVCLSEGPIETSLSKPFRTGSDNEKQEEKVVRKVMAKSVPEEAMTDLIRLVHGNPCGIKKLVKEFRFYWRQKTSPKQEETKASETANQTAAESMEVEDTDDKDGEKPAAVSSHNNSPEIAESSEGEFAISKRQLEMKIPSIATREKRGEKKILWYVKEEVLKQYAMEDLKLPNSWQYVCIKEPLWAKEKATPKAEDAAPAKTVAGGRSTPNIMQFAQPMLPEQIQALGSNVPGSKDAATANDTLKEPMVIDENLIETPTTASKAIKTPAKTIKDMFSPVSRKQKQPDKTSPSAVNEVVRPQENPGLSPVVVIKKLPKPSDDLRVKPISEASKKSSVLQSPKVLVSPLAKPKSVFDTVLTSPELMKSTPKTSSDKPNQHNDVIVLD